MQCRLSVPRRSCLYLAVAGPFACPPPTADLAGLFSGLIDLVVVSVDPAFVAVADFSAGRIATAGFDSDSVGSFVVAVDSADFFDSVAAAAVVGFAGSVVAGYYSGPIPCRRTLLEMGMWDARGGERNVVCVCERLN